MDNQTPTDKAIAMAQRMEQLEEWNNDMQKEIFKEREKHKHEMEVQKAYIAGIEVALQAILNRGVNLQ